MGVKREMDLPGELAERTLAALRRAGVEGEAHVSSSAGLRAEFAGGKLRSCSASGRLHLAVRLVHRGRVGFYATTDPGDPGLAVERAMTVAGAGEQLELAFPGPAAAKAPGEGPAVLDQQVAGLGAAGLVGLGQDLLAAVAAAAPGAVVQGGAESDLVETVLVNTSGAVIRRQATRIGAGAEMTRCRDQDVLALWRSVESARLDDPELRTLAPRLGELYAGAASQAKLPAGGKPRVVLAPEVVGVLLGPLMHGVDGINSNRGVSPLVGRCGQQVLGAGFTLADDPWLDWAAVSARWDDEGTPTERKHLFREGIFETFLHDLRSAAQGGVRSTGNGRGGRGQPPRISAYTLTLAPGHLPLGELLAAAEGGLYVASVIGGAPGALAGAFSHPVGVAYLIQEGRLAGRVKDVAISGNSYEVARHGLAGLEDRVHSIGGELAASMRVPHLLLEGVSVSGK